MLRDRGTIKWTSLMLPEYVELLKKMWRDTEKVNMPVHDSQELELMNGQLVQAYERKSLIVLSIYKDGFIEEISRTIMNFHIHQAQISLQTKNDLEKIINLNQLVSLRIVDK